MDYNEFVNTEDLISNLGNPILAEQFRIRKIVQDKFSKLEEEIKAEVLQESRVRDNAKTNDKVGKSKKGSKSLSKLNRPRKQDASNIKPKPSFESLSSFPLMEPPKAAEHFQTPDISSMSPDKDDVYPVFEVLPAKHPSPFLPLSSPRLIRKEAPSKNTGVFEYQHRQATTGKGRNRARVLTSHLIPGVDIKPELTIEYIPGISIPTAKTYRHPNITVVSQSYADHHNKPVLEDIEKDEDITHSITNSTTSKFEEMEKVVEIEKDEECGSEAEIKKRLRDRVKAILVNKYNLDLLPDSSFEQARIQVPEEIIEKSVSQNSKSRSSNTSSISKSKISKNDDDVAKSKVKDYLIINSQPVEDNSSDKSSLKKDNLYALDKDLESYSSSFEKSSEDKSSKSKSAPKKVNENADLLIAADSPASDEPSEGYAPKPPLSTIFEVSSQISRSKSKADGKLEEFDLPVTENTSITADLEDDDTLAQSCLELHSDAHTFNDRISEQSSAKESSKIELSSSIKNSSKESKSKENSDAIASTKGWDKETIKTSAGSKIKTVNSALNQDLSNKEPVSNNSNGRDLNKERSIEKEIVREEINDQIASKVQEMVVSIVNNDIFDSVFNFRDEDKDIPQVDQSEKNLDHEHGQDKYNSNEKPKYGDIYLDMNISTGPLDSSITSVESNIIEELIIDNDVTNKTSPEEIVQMSKMASPKQIISERLSSINEHILYSNSTVPNEKSISNEIEKENNVENVDQTCSSTDTTSSNTSLPQGISRGEVLPEVVENLASEGEFYQGSSLATTVQSRVEELSEGEHKSQGSWTSQGIDSTPESFSGTSQSHSKKLGDVVSSLSSGEWQASPRQIQRLATLAESFGLYN